MSFINNKKNIKSFIAIIMILVGTILTEGKSTIQFLPDRIIYDGQATEVSAYHNEFLAIANGNERFHEVKFQDLGFRGDYFFEFEASSSYSMCYGSWEITGSVGKDVKTESKQYIGEEFVTSKELSSFISCSVFSVNNEEVYKLAELMDIGENTYICCYEFSEDYFWDEMIMKDGMTAILVKENNLYWAERKSDPIEDGIYHVIF